MSMRYDAFALARGNHGRLQMFRQILYFNTGIGCTETYPDKGSFRLRQQARGVFQTIRIARGRGVGF